MPPSHQTVRLLSGNHRTAENGVCVMELASMLAGEPLSDRPRAVSGVIASAICGYNDGIDDVRRQTLKRFAAASVGTSGDRAADRRRRTLIGASIIAPPARSGLRAAIARRLACADPYEAARSIGKRVAIEGDDVLHGHMCDFLDRLIAAGDPEPGLAEALLAGPVHRARADTPTGEGPAPLPGDRDGGTLFS